ncbi:MAG TPA: hypothetical protein VET23_01670 [Chitinophagaceae bacterium]|nr:hypothetical protein [Chitinophagaceae bacterium]
MKKGSIVQFVCFETPLDADEFILQWEQYSKLASNDQEAVLQQAAEQKGRFRYVSQHCCHGGDFQFIFKQGKRSSHIPEVVMRVREAGGYIALQVEFSHKTNTDESKILAFVNNTEVSLEALRMLQPYRHLNIYQAYYENSAYAYILEFFVENNHAAEFMQQLKMQNSAVEIGLYKECVKPKKSKRTKATEKKVLV